MDREFYNYLNEKLESAQNELEKADELNGHTSQNALAYTISANMTLRETVTALLHYIDIWVKERA